MSLRYVTLPNGRKVGLGAYVNAWRALRTMPAGQMVRGFDHFPDEAGRTLARFRDGMHDRINRHLPGYGRGRRWSQDWHFAALRTARAVNTPRLIVRPSTVPHEFRARLAGRLTTD